MNGCVFLKGFSAQSPFMLKLYYCLLISQNPVNPPGELFIKTADTFLQKTKYFYYQQFLPSGRTDLTASASS